MARRTHNAALPFRTSRIERLAYGAYFCGQELVYSFIAGYLMLFYTDSLFMPALAASGIFLAAELFDVINEPVFGVLLDKLQLRSGRFKPWVKLSALVLPIITFALFLVPENADMSVKITYSAIIYTLWGVAYMAGDVPAHAMCTVMSDNLHERSTLITIARFACMATGMAVSAGIVPIIDHFGFPTAAAVTCILAYIVMLPSLKPLKERYAPKRDAQRHDIRAILSYLKQNKPMQYFYIAVIVKGSLDLGLTSYVCKYCFGSIEYIAVLTLASALPLLGVYIALPRLLRYYEKLHLYEAGVISSIALSAVIYFVGYGDVRLFIALATLRSIAGALPGILLYTIAADLVEYGHYTTGMRREGFMFSIQSFAHKFSASMAAILTGLVLSLLGYDDFGEALPRTAMDTLWLVYLLLPALGKAISLPIHSRYKLNDSEVQRMARANCTEESEASVSSEAGE